MFSATACFVVLLAISTGGDLIQDRALPDAKAVEQVLQDQSAAWNRQDLTGFMAAYWKSPLLTFFSGADISSGWQATLESYRLRYQSGGKEKMGKLVFSDLRVELLGPESAFVRGAWKLTMSDGKTPHGIFTLVFRKFTDGWKIVHDHSSTAP
jgi:beta-aspartyl-peptidase (threonine type)